MGALLKKKGTTGSSPRTGTKKFQYTPRTPEQVRERASRQIGARDSYFDQGVQFFTAKEGDNNVRILPPPPDVDWRHYGVNIAAHYGIGVDQSAFLCLEKMKGEPCPICEERVAATSKGEDELADALKHGFRTAVYVIDRNAENKGPMLWNISAGLDKDITKLCIDPGNGEALPVDDPIDGYDLSFVREGTGLTTKYKGIQFSRKSSPLADEEEDADKWLQFVVDNPIDSLLKFHEYDYIKKVLEGQAPPEDKEKAADPKTAARTARHTESGGRSAPKPAADKEKPAGRPTLRAVGAKAPAPKEEEQETAADLPTWDELQELDEDGLVALAEAAELEFPEEAFDGIEELREWMATQLEIEQPPKPTAAANAKGSWRDRLKPKKA